MNYVSTRNNSNSFEFKDVFIKGLADDGGLFYSGPTHSQDFTNVFRELVDFPVLHPESPEEALDMYRYAKDSDGPVMIVESKKFH